MELAERDRQVFERRRFRSDQEDQLAEYFASLGAYQLAVEATARYEWFVPLVEPTALQHDLFASAEHRHHPEQQRDPCRRLGHCCRGCRHRDTHAVIRFPVRE